MHGIIIVKTVLVLLRKVKWAKLYAIDNFVSFNAPIIPDMLTVNLEYLARDSTIQVILPKSIDGAMKLGLVGFVKNLKKFTIPEKILNILVMLSLLTESRLKSVMSRVVLDLFSMIEMWIVIPFNVILKQKNGQVSNI